MTTDAARRDSGKVALADAGNSGITSRLEKFAEAPRRIRGGNLTAIRGGGICVAPVPFAAASGSDAAVCAFDISATTAAVTAGTQQAITAGALSDESAAAGEWRMIALPFVLVDVGNVFALSIQDLTVTLEKADFAHGRARNQA